jgi:hypothetical protein
MAKTSKVRLSLASDLYMVAGVDKNSHKHKLYLKDILLEEEDMPPTERFGLAFIKRNENSHVYKAYVERTLTGYIKVNAWVRDYNVDLPRMCKEQFNTSVHSKIKGFIWLFCSHTLPVASRLRRKEANNKCPICGLTEDIWHMAYECQDARTTQNMVFREWWSRTRDHTWSTSESFTRDFFSGGNKVLNESKRTLNDITIYHISKCKCEFQNSQGNNIPLEVIANEIWKKFTSSIWAHINHIKAKALWWIARDKVRMVPNKVATQNLRGIEAENALLLDWEGPASSLMASLDDLHQVGPLRCIVWDRDTATISPPTFPIIDVEWKVRTIPKPNGKGMLVVSEEEVAHSLETQNSTSRSAD